MDEEGFGYLEKPLMDVRFRDADTGFAIGAYGLLLRTDDGGETWEDVSFDVDNEEGFHFNALTEVKDSGLFMVGEMGTMYRSADYGDTWETLEDTPYDGRSEEHTSELQSRPHLVCRLLLEKKKKPANKTHSHQINKIKQHLTKPHNQQHTLTHNPHLPYTIR